jgi:hypothetical protein
MDMGRCAATCSPLFRWPARRTEEIEMRRSRWIALSLMLVSGTMLLQNGCLGAFWRGMTQGWPDNRWLNLANDVAKEVLLG